MENDYNNMAFDKNKKKQTRLNSLNPGGDFAQADMSQVEAFQRRMLGIASAEEMQAKVEKDLFDDEDKNKFIN